MSYMSDPVADMLARIKNAYTTNMDTVVIPFSKLKADIANLDGFGKIAGPDETIR